MNTEQRVKPARIESLRVRNFRALKDVEFKQNHTANGASGAERQRQNHGL